MLIEQLLGKRLPDDPKDAQTPGHRLMLRGGYIRQIGQGIYSLLPLAWRACAAVETIIREEMDAIGGQELLMPVTSPAELWQESGRWDNIGGELVRFTDRTEHQYVLNMTHEEVIVDVARGNIDSYRQLPCMVYQIQTKFRDEPRSRAGLIRVREFTMKDAYSFHRTEEDLKDYYMKVHRAYHRIFKRAGLRNVIDIESDSGMMGGSVAHEFMLVTPIGEDTLVVCEESGYRANREVAKGVRAYDSKEEPQPLQDVETPGQKTIEEVTNFLGSDSKHACKCVAFMDENRAVLAFVRGDYDVNQAKLKKAANAPDLRPMQDEEFAAIGSVAGYVGPVGLDPEKVTLVFDESVVKSPNLIVGANKRDWHKTGFNFDRDMEGGIIADITDVVEGDLCPLSGKPLTLTRGIEVGNIFQLGYKYTKAMQFQYNEEDGTLREPIMGCYGIGVGRTMASVVEESHDDNGPVWPISIAPYKVQICCLQAKKEEIAAAANKAYEELRTAGLDPLLDARGVSAGFMFADADLIGAPIRLIFSKRNLEKGVAEVRYRMVDQPEDLPGELPLDSLAEKVKNLVDELMRPYTFEGVKM